MQLTYIDASTTEKHRVVSIPQAVGTIAIEYALDDDTYVILVSIPQAVGTIAIGINKIFAEPATMQAFQYRKR